MVRCKISFNVKSIGKDDTVVVVDVLRATSTIVTALANGVEEIIPVSSIDEAFKLRRNGYCLIGEEKGVKIKEFDFSNSPTEIMQNPCKKIALKTTNGTKIIKEVEERTNQEVFMGSTLNLSYLAERLKQTEKINIIAVGGRKGFIEDLAVSIALFTKLQNLPLKKEIVKELIINSEAAKHLAKIGYWKDVEFVLQIDLYPIAPILKKGKIVLEQSSYK